jgi:ADP-heptose:LPS heptosyltransferase
LKTKDLFADLPPQSRILLVRLRSMGDCLLLTSPLRALKEKFPGFRVTVAVERRFADCFSGNPDVEEVLSIGRKTDALGLLGRRFEAAINLHGGPTSLGYTLMTRSPHIGFAQFQYSRLYTALLAPPDPGLHSVEATMAAFRWLGVARAEPPPLRYEVQSEEARQIRADLGSRPYAVLHPPAIMETKRWEGAKFVELAGALEKAGLTTVLTCGPGEEGMVKPVAKAVPAARVFYGLRIPQLAELIRGARLFGGNDSGPMHLAAAVGTPVVALWGSSDSRRWRPWAVAHAVVQNPFECNPCPGYRCLVASSPLCIESVTVDQAVRAAMHLLTPDQQIPVDPDAHSPN